MIIAVANSKGGVGKSTLAVHLTAWLAAQGHSVTFVDCDAQRSSGFWVGEALPNIRVVRLETGTEIMQELPGLAEESDYVVADGPGSDSDRNRCLLMRANLAIVPCKASMLEVRALAAATDVLRQIQSVRFGEPRGVIVLSMVGKHYRLTREMQAAAELLELPVAKQAMTLRQVYADAPGRASVVWGLGTRAKEAMAEVEQLFRELLPDAVATKASSRRAKTAAPYTAAKSESPLQTKEKTYG